jgi:hypothetical protein
VATKRKAERQWKGKNADDEDVDTWATCCVEKKRKKVGGCYCFLCCSPFAPLSLRGCLYVSGVCGIGAQHGWTLLILCGHNNNVNFNSLKQNMISK